MASCKKDTVYRNVVQRVAEEGYTLTLTREEAATLMIVTHNVGGLFIGRRGYLEQIGKALREAGMPAQMQHPDVRNRSEQGLWFSDSITPSK